MKQSSSLPAAADRFFEGIDSLLNAKELALVQKAREFFDGDLSNTIQKNFSAGQPFPREIINQWAEEGFLGLQVPAHYGGHNASYLCKVRIAQEAALHSFAAAFSLNNLQGAVTRLALQGTEEQRNTWLASMIRGKLLGAIAISEPQAGSDLKGLSTVAKPTDGGWLIKGKKAWVTNGDIVDCPMVLTKIYGTSEDADLINLIVPCNNQATYIRTPHDTNGGWSFRLAQIEFNDHFVSDNALFGDKSNTMKYSLNAINAARVHVAAMAVATLFAGLCEAMSYCNKRIAFGAPLTHLQGLRWKLADVATRLEAANSLMLRAALSIASNSPSMLLAAQSKMFAVNTAIWGLDQCIRCVGATGLSGHMRLAMHHSEIRFGAYADGTGETLQDRISKSMDDYASPLPEAKQMNGE
ncbi:MAG: acyl-CoA dehydrogenase family protein [Burkholderiaceae bacterium]